MVTAFPLFYADYLLRESCLMDGRALVISRPDRSELGQDATTREISTKTPR